MNTGSNWPALPYDQWRDTLDTLHMKMQVAGKVKLALNSFLNQWWHVAFHLNLRGMTSGIIPYADGVFEISFDFISHEVIIRTSNETVKKITLNPSSVAAFYNDFMDTLSSLGISVRINTVPCEFSDPVPFELDHERKSHDRDFVYTWWKILLQVQRVFEKFRSGFRGKSSPVHFFWGSFDLCETRFSGNPCAFPPGSGRIMKYAENEENFTFGFWPGNKNYPHAAFYSYLYPAPAEMDISVKPGMDYYNKNMKEFILDYNDVINSPDPEGSILEFLNATYDLSAGAAGWDVELLRADVPEYQTI